MSPPKSTKPRAPASSPLDVSKKLRIIRGPKSFSALLISEGQADNRNDFQQLSRKFCTQFPPLVAASRKPATARRCEETPPKSLIKVPQWSALPSSPLRQPPTEETTDAIRGEEQGSDLDQIIYEDGRFLLKSTDSSMSGVEVSPEAIAERLMKAGASARHHRLSWSKQPYRPQTYIRYPLHKVASNTTRAFGKDDIFYHVRLEDYTFLIELNQWISKTFRHANLTWQILRWLLTQLLQPRNLPSFSTDGLEIGFAEHSAAGFDGCALPFVTGEANGALGEDRRCSLIPSLPTVLANESARSGTHMTASGPSTPLVTRHSASRTNCYHREDLPQALSRMPHGTLRDYQKHMGWFVTDELFVYLINMMELLAGTKEPSSFEAIYTEARDRLGDLAPHPRIMRQMYDYWKGRRAALGKPLVREFWAVPAATDNSPFAVFRARTKEKMVLRRPRRSAQDAGTRLQRHNEEFAKTDRLFQAVCQRDLIKLQMCDIDAILFEQLWKGCEDPSYAHPIWDSLKRRLGLDLDVEEKKRRPEVLKVSSSLEGFGDPLDDRSSTQHSHHPSKRRRVDERIIEMPRYQISASQKAMHRSQRTTVASTGISGPAPSDAVCAPDGARTSHGVHVSPLPLPPLFLNARADCSKGELHQILEANGVVHMEPVGYLDRSAEVADAEREKSVHVNFSLSAPSPNAGDFLVSAIAGLPLPVPNPPVTVPPPIVINGVDLSRCPVYYQSLRSLPAAVRHPSNLRLVVPFGPLPASLLPGKGGGPVLRTKMDSARGPPVRSWVRLGRHGRLWLDRQQFVVPTPHLLSPSPLPLNLENAEEITDIISPFTDARQSASRRAVVQVRTQAPAPLAKQLRQLAAAGQVDHVQSEDDVSILLAPQAAKAQRRKDSILCIAHGASGHFVCEVGQLSRLTTGGYSESGFYSGGAGGPESALAASSRIDLEPGFVGALGADDLRNAGGFGLFCYARHLWQRPELWKDLVHRSPSV